MGGIEAQPANVSAPAGRYGALTYTSYDAGGAAGGWQIKQQRGLTEAEAVLLRSRVSTLFDPGFPMPRFPSPAEVAALPRRLVYAPVPGGTAWWHTATAGTDASGRPGNVFAHVVLDRAPAKPSAMRPIELWRAPGWLAPYGADAVIEADFSAVEPIPGDAVAARAVVDFLFDPEHVFRLATLGALLDACAAAMAGGLRVVLATETTDRAAMWIAAVSRLMDPRLARCGFFFSTLERQGTLGPVFQQGVQLACVPLDDADRVVPGDGAVVLDEMERIEIGDLSGRPHRTSRGYEIAATEWSVMAQVMLLNPGSAEVTMQRVDALTEDLPSLGGEPAWALALAVSHNPDTFTDAAGEAARVLARSSPADLPEMRSIEVAALLSGELAASPEAALAALMESVGAQHPNELMTRLLLGLYAAQALASLEWLIRELPSERQRLPAVALTDSVATELVQLARAALGWIRGGTVLTDNERGVASGRLANLVAQLKLGDRALDEELWDTLDWLVYRLVVDDTAALIAELGPFEEMTQASFLRPKVERELETNVAVRAEKVGHRLTTDVLVWLYPEPPAPLPVEEGLALDGHRLEAEFAARFAAWQPASGRYAAYRPLAVWASLLDQPSASGVQPGLDDYFNGPPWSAEDLMIIDHEFPGSVPIRLMAASLKAAPSDLSYETPLADLCDRLMRRSASQYAAGDAEAVDLVRLRQQIETSRRPLKLRRREGWFQAESAEFAGQLDEMLRGAAYAAALDSVAFPPEVVLAIREVVVVGAVLGWPHDQLVPACRLLPDELPPLTPAEVSAITEALTGRTFPAKLGMIAVAGDPRFPEPALQDWRFSWLHQNVVEEGGGSMPFLAAYLLQGFGPEVTAETFADLVLEAAWSWLVAPLPNQKAYRAVERFVRSWVKGLQYSESRPSRWKARSS